MILSSLTLTTNTRGRTVLRRHAGPTDLEGTPGPDVLRKTRHRENGPHLGDPDDLVDIPTTTTRRTVGRIRRSMEGEIGTTKD